MITTEPAFRYWWTESEWSSDRSTGAYARITSTNSGWKWRVQHATIGILREGTSPSQKGARAACRRAIRKLEAPT